MGAVFPKIKIYVFLSIICLLINISACCIALADSTENYNDYLQEEDTKYSDSVTDKYEENETDVGAINFGFSAGSSFVPFFSIVSLLFLGLDDVSFTFISIIIAIIGALQLVLLIIIGLNFVPKVLGSGFDV